MDMNMEVKDELDLQAERLVAAAIALEAAAQRLSAIDLEAAQGRTAELEARLAAAEATIATLRASGEAGARAAGPQAAQISQIAQPRRTVSLAAKESLASSETASAVTIDAALASLSIEQRIAVKAGLMRSGLL